MKRCHACRKHFRRHDHGCHDHAACNRALEEVLREWEEEGFLYDTDETVDGQTVWGVTEVGGLEVQFDD